MKKYVRVQQKDPQFMLQKVRKMYSRVPQKEYTFPLSSFPLSGGRNVGGNAQHNECTLVYNSGFV